MIPTNREATGSAEDWNRCPVCGTRNALTEIYRGKNTYDSYAHDALKCQYCDYDSDYDSEEKAE